MVLTVVK